MNSKATLPALPPSETYRAIFEASSDGLVINDPDTGVVLRANPAFCRMHGYEQMDGLHPHTFIHPTSHALFEEFVKTVRDGKEFRGQAQDIRQDGTVFDVEVLGRGFTYRGHFAVLGVVRDVTDQMRAYHELDRQVAERTHALERRHRVAEALRELLAEANAGRSLESMLELVVHQAGQLLGSPATGISLAASADRPAIQVRSDDLHTVLVPRQFPLTIEGEALGALTLYYPHGSEATDDETELARDFADQVALVLDNALLRAETELRMRQQEALYRADEKMLGSLRLDDVLQALADVAAEVLEADKSSVVIWNEAGDSAHMPAARGFAHGRVQELIPADEARFMSDAFGAGPPVFDYTPALMPVGTRLRALHEEEGVHASLAAGIRVGDKVFGAFGVSYTHPRVFTEAERRMVLALAQRAGMAIQNAHLYEQAQQVAALEERQRLARELHDAVTQTLFSSALIADVIPDLWELDQQEGRRRLQELRRLSRGALAEMRSLLVELRPGALTELPLGILLQQLADATAGRSTLDVLVQVEGPPAPLPGDVQVALYRMAQEAVSNVIKHASASRARLRLCHKLDAVELTIDDDGRGFDPANVPPGHMGMGIMRERAQSVGARLKIRSRRGNGTSVAIAWRRKRR